MRKKQWGLLQWHLLQEDLQTRDDIQLWVRISAAAAMGLGTSIGGYKIIKTVGGKIMKIRPVNGAAADLSSAKLFLVLHFFIYQSVRRMSFLPQSWGLELRNG